MHVNAVRTPRAPWKGKNRAQSSREDFPSTNPGIVLSLQMLTSSQYESVYTLPILVGSNRQNVSLQVDTGSADLWIASTSCSSSACKSIGSQLYDPSSSTSTNQTLSLQYALGEVSGPIVWDFIDVGGYNISNQALVSVTSVDDEALEHDYDGILGLALPTDSGIAQIIPAEYSDTPNGAAFATNLFGLSSASDAAPFISLALARPGMSTVPSVLGIGQHPTELVPDPSEVKYADLVSGGYEPRLWEAAVYGITVYKDGAAQEVDIGTGYPSAVLDSGTAVILASPNITTSIYDALGISPSSDGNYYVSCTTPINMTITLDGRPPIPFHPLDLTYQASSSDSTCLGLIQNSQVVVGNTYTSLPQLILGVPFLRNTYTVMAYEPPDSNGSWAAGNTVAASDDAIIPQLGLMSLTNITEALQQFTTVRVNGESLEPNGDITPGKKSSLSVGVDIALGIVGFAVLCVGLFTAWLVYRRRRRRDLSALARESYEDKSYSLTDLARSIARRPSATDRYSHAEGTLHSLPYRGFLPSRDAEDISSLTEYNVESRQKAGVKTVPEDKFATRHSDASWDSFYLGSGPESKPRYSKVSPDTPPATPPSHAEEFGSPSLLSGSDHHRRLDSGNADTAPALPLLSHMRHPSSASRIDDMLEFGVGLGLSLRAEGQSIPQRTISSRYSGSTLVNTSSPPGSDRTLDSPPSSLLPSTSTGLTQIDSMSLRRNRPARSPRGGRPTSRLSYMVSRSASP